MSEILTLPPPATAEETDTDGPPLILRSTPDAIERSLALARTQLGMEVAIVSEFTEHEQVLRHQEGNPEDFGFEIGASTRLTDTYCWRVVNGHLPQVIPDAKSDVRLRDLKVTWEADIGSYIGVPIRLSNGLIYGSVFCLSHSANPSLSSWATRQSRDSRTAAVRSDCSPRPPRSAWVRIWSGLQSRSRWRTSAICLPTHISG